MITVVLPYNTESYFQSTLLQFIQSSLVKKIIIAHGGDFSGEYEKCKGMKVDSLTSGKTINAIIGKLSTDFLLFINQAQSITFNQAALERLVRARGRAVPERAGAVHRPVHRADAQDRLRHLRSGRRDLQVLARLNIGATRSACKERSKNSSRESACHRR